MKRKFCQRADLKFNRSASCPNSQRPRINQTLRIEDNPRFFQIRTPTKFSIWILAGTLLLSAAQCCVALEPFPLAQTVAQVRASLAGTKIDATHLRREDYLRITAGIVKYFQHFQTSDGRIIDPFLHKEVQYSTPCYAWAAAALVAAGSETNLLESASLALDAALQELSSNHAADNHGDFFTFPSMLAYENLRERVAPERRKKWENDLRAIEPTQIYRDLPKKSRDEVHNWNVVALSGEFLRHQDGFTDLSFVENYLQKQLHWFTSSGQYRDPNTPMAYDHFPRHFLAAIIERGYNGAHREILTNLLDRAAWTSLLMQSPRGELPTGGRSAQHQWNEAEQCVTYEIWSRRKQREGDAVAAQAFKRAAHLALQSIERWVRPSGELWIVKNRFDPGLRHGFQGYSSHSQYNLLAASMLSTAWFFADEEISEGAAPADTGGFAIELPEFHKIFANAGGLYLEIDTGADAEYNSTGLIRVHKTGIESLIGPSDVSPISDEALATGIAWREDGKWRSLASFGRGAIKGVQFSLLEAKPNHVRFKVRYELQRTNVIAVWENYDLTPSQIRVTAEIEGSAAEIKIQFPAFAFDGKDASQISVEDSRAVVRLNNCQQIFSVESPANVKLQRSGNWISSRNGFLEAIEGEVHGQRVVYTLTPRSGTLIGRRK